MTLPSPGTRTGTPVPARTLALAGIAAVALCLVLVGVLHAVAPEVNPVRRTISEYALGEYRVLFDAGVLALALGSVAVLGALLRAGLVRARSWPALLLVVWSLSLAVVVAFEKIDWSVGPTPGGYVHRYASLVAFVSLPVAAVLIGWARGRAGSRHAACAAWLGIASVAWLLPILGWFALRMLGVPGRLPLGLLERGLAATEVAVVLALGIWAWRAPAPAIMSR